ncbi:hypothetical protein P4631_00745 [Halalkalibacterium halodurans]|uniref:BH1759 protein n=1 Tax=Halalkalibacterium halodurans (strain ATCC BAA-125 / DSM 18197 / FERM 7344 / JCM 9153 / C-125) TaxID=272558 RepID=Q9KC15_HALH5|nr:hypothetical protein [Halalkalibacterium halodurans]MED4170975.1 hypothetical protein [Halalkalibacterium halodurans]BAB05478.1 BH1759 [Halalkalibacterium halodurans C-125]
MSQELKNKVQFLAKELNQLVNILYEESKKQTPLTLWLLCKNTFVYLYRTVKTVRGVAGVLLVLVPGSLMAYTTDAFRAIGELPWTSITVLLGGMSFFLFAYLRHLVLDEMSRPGSDLFHIQVYEKRKPDEYMSLIALAKERDYVESIAADIEQVTSTPSLPNLLELLKEKEQDIEEKDRVIEDLLEIVEDNEEHTLMFKEKYEILLDFVFQLKSKLNLLVHDQFSLDSIDFGSDYSLYKVGEEGLEFVDSYGVNKAEMEDFIPFTEKGNPYILAIERDYKDPLKVGDLISWKRTLQDGSQWVLSLHLNENSREKLNDVTESGKLNVTITQELLWICCELLNKFSPNPTKKGEE